MKKIIVIGAGVNGLMIAYHLNKIGYSVDIYEKNTIENSTSPSFLEFQMIRPHYPEHLGWSLQIENAISAWKQVFGALGRNYFVPNGVIAISRSVGDWTDCAINLMKNQNLPFRILNSQRTRQLMAGFVLPDQSVGLLAEYGGVIRAQAMLTHLSQYLKEQNVRIFENTEITKADDNCVWIKGNPTAQSGDWVVATAALDQLMPEEFTGSRNFRSYFLDIKIPEGPYRSYWRYTPNWADLGGDGNLWGMPCLGLDGKIRLGCGSITDVVSAPDQEFDLANKKAAICDYYRPIMFGFEEYEVSSLQSIGYVGKENGQMRLSRKGQLIGLQADSGHGFKFAAQNAGYIAEAIENEAFGMAARRVAGLV